LIIFIKLFISQYRKYKTKLNFTEGKKDVTNKYIEDFAKCTKYFTNGVFVNLLMGKNDEKEKKDYIDLLSDNYENDLKNTKFDIPLIFITRKKNQFCKLMIPETSSKRYKTSEDFLNEIKIILDLPNDVKDDKEKGEKKLKSLLSILHYKTDNYVITNDNFKKMVLIIYRIKENIPVIIMGETGCGKTALITKLNQILNNGKITVKIINIHPWDY
jgi:midasin (ATPase involved in ribosome maturation)